MIKQRIDLITLGCSKNLVDSERLMAQLAAVGFRVFHDPDAPKGEIVIVNTCGFIGDAKEESINTILGLIPLKQRRKIGKIFVMGCLSQRYREELTTEIPEIDRIYGKFDWKDILTDLGYSWQPRLPHSRTLTTPAHYAYVKISEGCNRKCAYCAIPLITGRQQSRSQDDILDEVQTLVQHGVHEIQLIAQDLTDYGLDLTGQQEIATLVARIAETPGVEWLRLHYAYPNAFPRPLLAVMASHSNICRYLDLALQHAADPVLTRMHRHITCEETRALLHEIRAAVPGIHLRTTMMVGFPGETEADFEAILAFVSEMRFERLGAFAYSEEEGTYAALHYPDDVPAAVKQQRLDRLMSLQQTISEEIQQQKVGMTLPVRLDRIEGDYYIGRTEYDSPEVDPEVLLPIDSLPQVPSAADPTVLLPKPLPLGRLQTVRITSATAYELYAVLA